MRSIMKVSLLALLVLASLPSMAQSGRQWSKHSDWAIDHEVQGVWSYKWSYIRTTDDQYPYLSRRLFRDNAGSLLVIRTSLEEPAVARASISIQDIDTGETLTFVAQHMESMTIQLLGGGAPLVIPYTDVVAFSGADGSEFPPGIKTAAQTMIATASQGFEDALRRLALHGCYENADLYIVAAYYAHLLYSDIDCTDPPRYAPSPQIIHGFDPNVTSPTEFERQFGAAYYE